MNDEFLAADVQARLDQLLTQLCDGTLSDAEGRELAALLENSAAARREYLAYLDLNACLLGEQPWAIPAPAKSPLIRRPAARTSHRWLVLVWMAAACVIVGFAMSWRASVPVETALAPQAGPPAVPPIAVQISLGTLAELAGTVEWLDPTGNVSAARQGDRLVAGHTLRTGADDSLAVLVLSDGSRLELSPAGQLRSPEGNSSTERLAFVLAAGLLQADVKPRPPSSPLVVLTPQAEVVVLGTRFTVSAAEPAATGVATESGLVRVVRVADGRSAEVPPGHYVVAGPSDASLEVRPNVELPAAPRATLAFERARSMAYSSDGAWLTVASSQYWESLATTTGDTRFPRQSVPEKTAVNVSEDGSRLLASGPDTQFQVWDAITGNVIGSWDALARGHFVWTLNRDGRYVAIGHQVSGPPDHISVWDLKLGKSIATLSVEAVVTCVAISPDGRYVAAGLGRNRSVREFRLAVWNIAEQKRMATIVVPEQLLQVASFSPDSRRIAGATQHGAAHLWEIDTGATLVSRGAVDGWTQPIRSLAFSADGMRLALGTSNGRVRLWNLSHDTDLGMLVIGKRIVSAVAFAPDGRTLAACTVGDPISLWDLP